MHKQTVKNNSIMEKDNFSEGFSKSLFKPIECMDLGMPGNVTTIAFDPLQKVFATGTDNGYITIFGRNCICSEYKNMQVQSKKTITQLRFCNGKPIIVAVDVEDTVTVFDTHDQRLSFSYTASGRIKTVGCFEKSSWFFLGLESGRIYFINVENGLKSDFSVDYREKGSSRTVIDIKAHPDAKKFVVLVGYIDGLIVEYSLSDRVVKNKYKFENEDGDLTCLVWSPCGQKFFSMYDNGVMILYSYSDKTTKKRTLRSMIHPKNSTREKCAKNELYYSDVMWCSKVRGSKGTFLVASVGEEQWKRNTLVFFEEVVGEQRLVQFEQEIIGLEIIMYNEKKVVAVVFGDGSVKLLRIIQGTLFQKESYVENIYKPFSLQWNGGRPVGKFVFPITNNGFLQMIEERSKESLEYSEFISGGVPEDKGNNKTLESMRKNREKCHTYGNIAVTVDSGGVVSLWDMYPPNPYAIAGTETNFSVLFETFGVPFIVTSVFINTNSRILALGCASGDLLVCYLGKALPENVLNNPKFVKTAMLNLGQNDGSVSKGSAATAKKSPIKQYFEDTFEQSVVSSTTHDNSPKRCLKDTRVSDKKRFSISLKRQSKLEWAKLSDMEASLESYESNMRFIKVDTSTQSMFHIIPFFHARIHGSEISSILVTDDGKVIAGNSQGLLFIVNPISCALEYIHRVGSGYSTSLKEKVDPKIKNSVGVTFSAFHTTVAKVKQDGTFSKVVIAGTNNGSLLYFSMIDGVGVEKTISVGQGPIVDITSIPKLYEIGADIAGLSPNCNAKGSPQNISSNIDSNLECVYIVVTSENGISIYKNCKGTVKYSLSTSAFKSSSIILSKIVTIENRFSVLICINVDRAIFVFSLPKLDLLVNTSIPLHPQIDMHSLTLNSDGSLFFKLYTGNVVMYSLFSNDSHGSRGCLVYDFSAISPELKSVTSPTQDCAQPKWFWNKPAKTEKIDEILGLDARNLLKPGYTLPTRRSTTTTSGGSENSSVSGAISVSLNAVTDHTQHSNEREVMHSYRLSGNAFLEANEKLKERGEKLANLGDSVNKMSNAAHSFLGDIKAYNQKQANKKWWQF